MAQWHASLDQLVNALASIYNTQSDARRIASSTGLDPALIDFDPRMRNTWYAVLQEALKQGKVADLVNRARAEYPVDATLQQAQAAYLAWQQQPAEPQPTTKPFRPVKLTNPQKMQLVEALLKCPSIKNRQRRNAVVDSLRDNIKDNVERDDAARLDVFNIVNTALNYAGGLQELVEAVRFFDDGTEDMAELDRVVASFG